MFQVRIRPVLLTIVAVLALVTAACGTSETTATSATNDTMGDMEMEEGHDEEFVFGEPADEADADRTIEITAGDDLKFDPAEITVSAGEIVAFKVTNVGNLPHDFTLGDEETQQEHDAEMAEMMESGEMMHDEPNAVALEAGETKTVTWHFTEAGTVLIGCHQPGHYAAGMKAEVTVES